MRPSICYVATYDPAYSRNTDTIRALKRAGARVELVAPGSTQRESLPRSQMPKPGIASLRHLVARVGLPVDVMLRMLRCQALAVGYFGQADMLLLAPLAKRLGKPVLFNPLVTLDDTLVEDRNLVDAGSLLAAAIARLDRRALELADLVLVDTPENASHIARDLGVDAARIIVFPVGVDQRVFYPAHDARLMKAGRFDVLFYGKFIPLHGVETIVKAAAIVEQCHPGVRFELVGVGQRYAGARALASRLRIKSISWTDWLPYEALGARLRETDVALGVFSGGTKAARVIPNKVHQALACGVPVVTRRSPAVERLLVDGDSALLVPPDDPAALARALLRLADDRDLRRRIGACGRDAWLAHASEDRLEAIAREALERLGLAR